MTKDVIWGAQAKTVIVKRHPVIEPEVRTLQYGTGGNVAHGNQDMVVGATGQE